MAQLVGHSATRTTRANAMNHYTDQPIFSLCVTQWTDEEQQKRRNWCAANTHAKSIRHASSALSLSLLRLFQRSVRSHRGVWVSIRCPWCASQCCKWVAKKNTTTARATNNLEFYAVRALARSHFSSIYHWIFKLLSVCAASTVNIRWKLCTLHIVKNSKYLPTFVRPPDTSERAQIVNI